MSTTKCLLDARTQVAWAVEVAVGDGFHNVVAEDVGGAFEVGNGAGDLEDAVVGPRTHVHPFHGMLTNPHERKGQKLSLLMTWKSEFG